MILDKTQIPQVAINKMNEVHDTEIEILNKLYSAAKDGNIENTDKYLEEFLNDVKEHFSFEQGLMEKYNFFAYPMHRGEHDRVLMELNQLKKDWDKNKNPDLIVSYIERIFVPWIINHVQTMDTVTAMYLSQFIRG